MRHVLLPLLLLLLLPSAAAAGGTIESKAPILLQGKVGLGADRVGLFHLAFANGTLQAVAFNGTLWVDHVHRYDCDPGYTPSTPQPPSRESHVYLDSVPGPIRLEAQARSATQVTSTNATRLELQLQDRSAPGVIMGPNPYLWSGEPFTYSHATDDDYAEVFPRGEFLAAPLGRLGLLGPLKVELESGNFTASNGGVVSQLTAGSSSGRQTIDCENIITPAVGKRSGTRETISHYRLMIDTGSVNVQQNGVTNLQQFYAAQRGVSEIYREGRYYPPRGYWYRNQGEGVQRMYDDLALPNTLLSGTHLRASVDGVVGLLSPKGKVATSELTGADAELAGNLEVLPLSQTEEGRRMESQIDGQLLLTKVTTSSTTTDYKPYAAGAAAGVLLSGLLFYGWPAFKFRLTQLLLLPLYARLRKEDILENAIRDDILHVVGQQPGISASELGRHLECGWGTLVYHLTVLERMRLISSAREGRHKRFFVQGRINYSDKGALAILANPAARIILDAIQRSPGIIQKDLGDRVGLSAGTVAWHVERLAAQGLVLKEEDGRSVRYLPSERLMDLTSRTAA